MTQVRPELTRLDQGSGTGARVGAPSRPVNTVNALIHLYRGEMGRLTTYRVRLDTTTSWAITSSALIATFVLGNSQMPHAALLVLMLVIFFFLQIEARRFRAYETSRHRILLLERYFYPEVLGAAVDPRWTEQLLDALRTPGLTVNRLGAIGWRLRRTYLWIYAVVLLSWLGKLHIAGDPILDLSEIPARAAIGTIPGSVVLALVALLYAWLIGVAITARRIYPLGDDEARQMMEELSDE